MIEKRNAYEIVGTNKIVVDRLRAFDNNEKVNMTKDEIQRQNELKKDSFILEKKKGKIAELSRRIEIAQNKISSSRNSEEKARLRLEIASCKYERDHLVE